MHLKASILIKTIKDKNEASLQDTAKSLIFLRRYLDEGKYEYMNVKEPHILWKDLKDRSDHQKAVILPNTK